MVAPKRKRVNQALSLERFASAKRSGYDKQRRVQREFALNAKKVNKYRKLKKPSTLKQVCCLTSSKGIA